MVWWGRNMWLVKHLLSCDKCSCVRWWLFYTKLTNILLMGSVKEHKRWMKLSGKFTEIIKGLFMKQQNRRP